MSLITVLGKDLLYLLILCFIGSSIKENDLQVKSNDVVVILTDPSLINR